MTTDVLTGCTVCEENVVDKVVEIGSTYGYHGVAHGLF